MPWAYWISRICDEFPCYGPEEAEEAWLRAPCGWFEEIIEARHYARAKADYESRVKSKHTKGLHDEPIMRRVKEIRFAIKAEEIEAQKAKRRDE